MKKIRLIASDIDGTLLPHGVTRIPERTLTALKSAIKQGITVVPASGRMLSGLPRELYDLPGIRYYLTSNGACVTDKLTGDVIYQRSLSPALTADILRRLQEFDVYTCIYLKDGVYNQAEIPEEKLARFYSYRMEFFRQNPRKNLASFAVRKGQPVEKVFVVVFSEQVKEEIRQKMAAIPGIRTTSSAPWNLEISHSQADKGLALAALAEHLGLGREEILAIGDNENDYAMLTYAGTALVPANGTDRVRLLADFVAAPCEECGVAEWIEENLPDA